MNQELIIFDYQNKKTGIKNITLTFTKDTIQEVGLNTKDRDYMQQCKEPDMDVELIVGYMNGNTHKLSDNPFFIEQLFYDSLSHYTLPAEDTLAMIDLLSPFWPFLYSSYNLPPNKNSIVNLHTKISEKFIKELYLAKENGKQLLI